MLSAFKVYVGQQIDIAELAKTLVKYNYHPCSEVGSEGDFARRAGIVDVFPVSFENPVRFEFSGRCINTIRSFDLISARTLDSHNMAIILPRSAFKQQRSKEKFIGIGEELPIDNFVDISPGDYVVHVNHGIARYLGMEKLNTDKGRLDHMVLEYADCDKLYVCSEDMHLINKYIAFQGINLRLSKLGSPAWQNIKKKTKQGIAALAADLLRMQAARAALKGFNFLPDNDWQKQLEGSFPYQETPDQVKTTLEVKKDMESARPMDRLICGDVGYGKTEIALRAAFKAVMSNKQVAILVPTTLLAQQHHYTFTQRLKDFPVNVKMLSRFNTQSEQKKIIEDIKSGAVDVAIGTHRILSSDIKFKDLGLVIIDEEQRFGVKDKEKLKQLRLLVDVLTLTATPIPRTLYMSLMEARDMSIINTPPLGRMAVQTDILAYDEELIKKSISRELNRGGQCFVIHNRVKDIERLKDKISDIVPQASLAVAHGQMPEKALEQIMLQFMQGKIDVLIATTIVQSGIDIPNANTLIVNRADLFGLADLYQLRGRVGRFKYKAYALFLVPPRFVWTEDAKRRLKAIEKFTRLGSGFKIAMEDLQIRGAGNLLGAQQHGFIAAVGFDLYCRLLREAIHGLDKK